MTARSTLTYSPGAAGPVLASLGGTDLGWQDMALCSEVDPELWFPPKDFSGIWKTAKAKAICADCPVRPECLDYALTRERRQSSRIPYGIYGGLTARERYAILTGRAEVTDLEPAA